MMTFGADRAGNLQPMRNVLWIEYIMLTVKVQGTFVFFTIDEKQPIKNVFISPKYS